MEFRSNLKNAKNTGASGHVVSHWWALRVSAIFLVILSAWFIIYLIRAVTIGEDIFYFLSSPIHASFFVLFIVASLYHGCLGMKEIYEDYISCKSLRNAVIITTNLVSITLGIIAVLAVINLHINNFSEKTDNKNYFTKTNDLIGEK